MSLLDKASLIVTPNAVKAGKLYSVIPNTGLGDLDVVRNTTATRVNELGLIENIAANVPRIDYTDGNGSILVEPQRTNSITYSEQVDNSYWVKSSIAVSVNSIISPDGIQTADLLTSNVLSKSEHRIRATVVLNPSTTYTASIFVKLKDPNINFYFRDLTRNVFTIINLNNQTILTGDSFFSVKIKAYSNNFFRLELSFTTNSTISNSLLDFGFTSSNISFDSVIAEGQGLYLWGVQLEQGSYATSYIPTLGSAVTRNADVISKTGISDLINSQEGVLFFEMAALSDDLTVRTIHISDGGNNNAISVQYRNTSNTLFCLYKVDGVNVGIGINNLVITDFHKIAFSYKLNSFKLFIDGVLISEDNSGNVNAANTFNQIGLKRVSDEFWYGKLRELQIYKTALTDTQLTTLTTL
jgi:hypothetical protein